MTHTKIPLGSLEKAMEIKFTLIFFASLAFMDCYLLLRHNLGVISIDIQTIKKMSNIKEVILLVSFFTLTFSTLIPVFSYIGRMTITNLIILLSKKYPSLLDLLYQKNNSHLYKNHQNAIRIDTLRHHAIKTSNLPEYNYSIEKDNKNKENTRKEYLCKTIILFTFLGYFLGNEKKQSILYVIESFTNSLPWYIGWPSSALLCILLFLMFAFAFKPEDEYENLVYLPNHQINNDS